MKRLLASYGREEEFRAVAEEIIREEEEKKNRVLAKSLRASLNKGAEQTKPRGLAPLLPFPDAAGDFVERIEPVRSHKDITLAPENVRAFVKLIKEFRSADRIRKFGLPVRSKLLFCGPPGCGKTLCAEVFAYELGLPLFVVKLDRLISSYLGETASNIRKVFEFARKQPCVLFLDEFDAIASARGEAGENSELRRVVNSLLLFIERIKPSGFLVAATNLDRALDPAIWRRFDDVVWFEPPDQRMIRRFVLQKFKNVNLDFDPLMFVAALEGYSYAEIERVCFQAIKSSIVERRDHVVKADLKEAVSDEARRRAGFHSLPSVA